MRSLGQAHESIDPWGNPTFEWWHEDRKVTAWIEEGRTCLLLIDGDDMTLMESADFSDVHWAAGFLYG